MTCILKALRPATKIYVRVQFGLDAYALVVATPKTFYAEISAARNRWIQEWGTPSYAETYHAPDLTWRDEVMDDKFVTQYADLGYGVRLLIAPASNDVFGDWRLVDVIAIPMRNPSPNDLRERAGALQLAAAYVAATL